MEFLPGEYPKGRQGGVFLIVHNSRILTHPAQPGEPISPDLLPSSSIDHEQSTYIGEFRSEPCFALEVSNDLVEGAQFSADLSWLSLRELLGAVSDERFQMLGRALQLLRWSREHKFCGSCGNETRSSDKERARYCEKCDVLHYPKLAPCVICLVRKGNKCLLARHSRFSNGMFSTLAGFVEPGETLEEALRREILEEVGIEAGNFQYFGSQPWPFPGQLMIGFTAEYIEGELTPDGEEIVEADWFQPDNLPLVPPESTISGSLITQHVKKYRKGLV